MSRQLRTQRCRSSKYSHAVRNLYDSDPDDPRPSTSGEGPRRLRNAPESHFYLYETASGRGEMREALDSSAQPANSGRSTAIPNIPDSDWDMDVDDSDDDADYSPEATESATPTGRSLITCRRMTRPSTPTSRCQLLHGVPGVEEACLLHADSTAREILDCFLTPELWDTMTRETNRYVEQRPVTPSSHMKTWENTTVEELQSFIGLRLLMGLQPRPHSRYYWSKNRLLSSSVFPETMTRDRFDLLQSRLHFSDNEDPRADTDRLWKLRPVLDILDTTFKTVYIPDRKIVVDESLWAFRGRHHAIQFNPTKRARFGMKVYRLCESDGAGAGYTSAFNVYMGQDRGDVPASMKAVTDLMNRACFFEKGYELYLDNWYSSPELFHYLSSRKTNAVGTVRLNRKFMPKDLKVSARGDVDFRTSATGMLAMSWMDRKPVHMLSTIHGPDMVDLPPNRRGIVGRSPKPSLTTTWGRRG
ncbi:hypothetical protein C7M84_018125 [Penaeus vannamei]|uniref:PiggyBac transposable element-derived protein domain-containing protein n=1 Tax=Penaeus vannamei TaxID=6689 RepID=A0A3R7NQC7_PENVA|nr:hypothetical protein C7M84_018125 [Penaeus vannamei]